MKFQRRSLFVLSALSFAAAAFTAPAGAATIGGKGHVYTQTNAAAGNEVKVFTRGEGTELTLTQTISTQGAGAGADLGSQGSVMLSHDGNWLFVANAGSGTVSTFAVASKRITLVSTVASGGAKPISVTEFGGFVYVLNGGAGGGIAGFENDNGTLVPLADGARGLSSAADVGAAQVSFDHLGRTVVVTEKTTNLLTTYASRPDGTLSQPLTTPATGTTPFGFVFDVDNHLLVTEAATASMSSYKFKGNAPQVPVLVSASIATTQPAPCWAAVTPNGQYAFSANAAAPGISTFSVAHDGTLTLAKTVTEPTGAHPSDMAVSASGKRLFVLNNGNGTISGYAISNGGALQSPSTVAGLPLSSNGLAVD